jgi:hypothetical protein
MEGSSVYFNVGPKPNPPRRGHEKNKWENKTTDTSIQIQCNDVPVMFEWYNVATATMHILPGELLRTRVNPLCLSLSTTGMYLLFFH